MPTEQIAGPVSTTEKRRNYAPGNWPIERLMDSAHNCLAPDCPMVLRPGHLFCALHWRDLPAWYRQVLREEEVGSRLYRDTLYDSVTLLKKESGLI